MCVFADARREVEKRTARVLPLARGWELGADNDVFAGIRGDSAGTDRCHDVFVPCDADEQGFGDEKL